MITLENDNRIRGRGFNDVLKNLFHSRIQVNDLVAIACSDRIAVALLPRRLASVRPFAIWAEHKREVRRNDVHEYELGTRQRR